MTIEAAGGTYTGFAELFTIRSLSFIILKLGIVVCTTLIIYENKRPNIESLLKKPKTPLSNKSFLNWQMFVKRWPIKSTTFGQADNQWRH